VTLSSARGPLGSDPAGRFTPPLAPGTVFVEPHPRRVQAIVGGEVVIDTEAALLVHRPGQPPRYALPLEVVGALPHEPVAEAPGYVHVPWDSADSWIEEGRVLVQYPPNPYHRIDCRPTQRRLRVEVAGTLLVDTHDTIILFETALEPKLYAPKASIRMDVLHPTDTSTYCNYKGWATYWSATIDGTVVDDVAWSYEDTYPESAPIQGWLSFDETRAKVTAQLPRRQ
jgi:uncharacterized protein (DUF427 family)